MSGSVKLKLPLGGSKTISAPDSASDETITLPAGTKTLATVENFTSTGIDDNATSTAVTLDSSGNMGLGVVPESDWDSGGTSLSIEDGSLVSNSSTGGGHWTSSNNAKQTSNNYTTGWNYKNTDEASQHLQVAGQHQFRVAPSGTADTAISWTNAMTIDNSGRVTMPNQPAFHARAANGINNINCTLTNYTVAYTNVTFNTGNHFNSSTGIFTAPVSGVYLFTANTRIDNFSEGYAYFTLEASGSHRSRDLSVTSGTYVNRNVSAVVYMGANDTAHCYLRTNSDTSINVNDDSFFSGYLIG